MHLRFLSTSFALALSALNALAASGTAIPGGAQTNTFVIDKPGAYYLAGDRTMTSANTAISITSDDVTLDLNGYCVSSAAAGITAFSRTNVEIRNGSVGPTKYAGINTSSCTLLRIIDVRVSEAGYSGISYFSAKDTLIERCSAYGCGTDGITSDYNAEGTVIRNCSVKANKGRGMMVGRDALVINCIATENHKSGIVALSRSTVEACLVTRNNSDLVNDEGGIIATDSCAIRRNNLTANTGCAVYVSSDGAGTVIEDNSITAVKSANNRRYGVYMTSFNGAKALLTNNRFHDVGTKATDAFVDGGGNVVF
jgi:hypothetical protein